MIVPDEWIKEQEDKNREKEIEKWQKKFSEANTEEEWKLTYNSYLSSKLWNSIKKEILDRAEEHCEECGNYVYYTLRVHHKTYKRIGGREKPDDLEALCKTCHPQADQKRERETTYKQKQKRYEGLIHWFATKYKKYNDWWRYEKDERSVEQDFLRFKYKKYCEEHNKSYSRHLKIPDWFKAWVWDGENEDELKYLDNDRRDNWYI